VVEGRCRLRQAMIRDKRLPELYLIPAAQTRDKTAVSPTDMSRLMDELRPEADWVLVDSPAGIERGFKNAIAGADTVMVVTNPEISAVRDADRVIGLLEAEGKGAPSLVINRLNASMVRRGDMLSVDDVLDLLAIRLVGIVPEDENVIVASNRGQPIAADGKSRAGQAFQNIAHRLMGEDVPFMDLDHPDGFWTRISRLTGRK
jgi:septum site-determining protein MinD